MMNFVGQNNLSRNTMALFFLASMTMLAVSSSSLAQVKERPGTSHKKQILETKINHQIKLLEFGAAPGGRRFPATDKSKSPKGK